jgi:hypothetical protein
MLAAIESRYIRRRRRTSCRHQFDDATALQHDAAFGAFGENGEGILDPERQLVSLGH